MFLKNDKLIREKKSDVLSWVKAEPGKVLSHAESANSGTPIEEYLADLQTLLTSKFKRSCKIPEGRSVERERVVVRYVVHMHLKMMDSGRTKSKSALLQHRNPETPVEASMRAARDQPQRPSTAVVSSLQSAKSFRTLPAGVNPSPTITTPPTTVANNLPSNNTTPLATVAALPPEAKLASYWASTRVATIDLSFVLNTAT
jgi:hypothetical protein